jgi:hypothetical protein
MVALGVLQCPVCEKVCFYQQKAATTRDRLKELASDHLSSHRLDESKQGIYRVMMADKTGEIQLSDANDTPIREWIPPTDGLPQQARNEL